MPHLALEKVEISRWEMGFVDSKWSNLNASGSYNPVIHFWVHCVASLSLHAGNGKCYMWLTDRVEIYYSKIVLWADLSYSYTFVPFYLHAVKGKWEIYYGNLEDIVKSIPIKGGLG